MEFEDFRVGLTQRLGNFLDILQDFAAVGMDVRTEIDKIKKAREELNGECLRAAFAGAFSDGKTSVAAGWLGRVEADMKIDNDESSDALAIYHPEGLEGRCEIVDTPGLFGDKTKITADGTINLYSDQTKHYLSRAHLVFCVLDAVNPLKGSHAEMINWLLRDLGKLSTTIFVINKMDLVSDLSDAEGFDDMAKIKSKNLTGKLCEYARLTPPEEERLRIVCVAANPDDRGLETWMQELGVPGYEAYSRIGDLKALAAEILRETALPEMLAKTGLDVLAETVRKLVEDALRERELLNLRSADLADQIRTNQDQLQAARGEIVTAGQHLQDRLHEIENNLLRKVRTLEGNEELIFLETEIGHAEGQEAGYKLRHTINRECQDAFGHPRQALIEVGNKISASQEENQSLFAPFGGLLLDAAGQGFSHVAGMDRNLLRDGILALRDFTGVSIKFKPYGALKLADNLKFGANALPVAVEAVAGAIETARGILAENNRKGRAEELASFVKAHFLPLYDILTNDDKVVETFAPALLVMEEELADQHATLLRMHEIGDRVQSIHQRLSEVFVAQLPVATDLQ